MSIEKKLITIRSFLLEIFNTIESFIKVILKWGFRGSNIPKINSDTCIVLGNGPSLATTINESSNVLKNYPLFCVNGFSTSAEYTELKPQNYVLMDPGFWLHTDQERIQNMLNGIITKTTWKLNLFIPHEAYSNAFYKHISKKNSLITVIYINYIPYKGFKKLGYFLFSKNWAMPQSQNVLIAALYLAINGKAKNIYLVGADHDWHKNIIINNDNELYIVDTHFYGQEKRKLVNQIKERNVTMEELCSSLSKAFAGYNSINRYATFRGIAIYNANPNSFVDAFKRKPLQELNT